MPNEEKLLKLLQIAVENEWKPYDYFIDLFQINRCQCKFKISVIEGSQIYFRPVWNISFDEMSISLNDLVTNFEEDEMSFLKALVNVCGIKNLNHIFLTFDSNNSFSESLRIEWVLQPTSQRLDWLFQTFNHLL